jgi:hypothetical protein
LLGWLSKYAKVKIWQIMILDVIWFTTISCQPLTFVAKSMVTFLPNFYLQNLLHDKNCDKASKSWKKKYHDQQLFVANQTTANICSAKSLAWHILKANQARPLYPC